MLVLGRKIPIEFEATRVTESFFGTTAFDPQRCQGEYLRSRSGYSRCRPINLIGLVLNCLGGFPTESRDVGHAVLQVHSHRHRQGVGRNRSLPAHSRAMI